MQFYVSLLFLLNARNILDLVFLQAFVRYCVHKKENISMVNVNVILAGKVKNVICDMMNAR